MAPRPRGQGHISVLSNLASRTRAVGKALAAHKALDAINIAHSHSASIAALRAKPALSAEEFKQYRADIQRGNLARHMPFDNDSSECDRLRAVDSRSLAMTRTDKSCQTIPIDASSVTMSPCVVPMLPCLTHGYCRFANCPFCQIAEAHTRQRCLDIASRVPGRVCATFFSWEADAIIDEFLAACSRPSIMEFDIATPQSVADPLTPRSVASDVQIVNTFPVPCFTADHAILEALRAWTPKRYIFQRPRLNEDAPVFPEIPAFPILADNDAYNIRKAEFLTAMQSPSACDAVTSCFCCNTVTRFPNATLGQQSWYDALYTCGHHVRRCEDDLSRLDEMAVGFYESNNFKKKRGKNKRARKKAKTIASHGSIDSTGFLQKVFDGNSQAFQCPILWVKEVLAATLGYVVVLGDSRMCVPFLIEASRARSLFEHLSSGGKPTSMLLIEYSVEIIQNKRFPFLLSGVFNTQSSLYDTSVDERDCLASIHCLIG